MPERIIFAGYDIIVEKDIGEILQGKVIKIFSDFYYVQAEDKLIECKLREVIKKSGTKIFVGDDVNVEDYNEHSNQGAIFELLPRKNNLMRPNVANIDLIILVVSLKHPKTPLNSVDRYLAQAIYQGIELVICVNKSDLTTVNDQNAFRELYQNLGYKVVFTSAIQNTGIENLKEFLSGKTSLLCGPSGVGKTSLCNAIDKNFVLKTGNVSKNSRGSHTTRHCEILHFNVGNIGSNLVDTPGFSLLKFDYIKPKQVEDFFPEIKKFAADCKFSDCLHEKETDCNVLKNIAQIPQSRYESYLSMLQEAKEYKKKIQEQGTKTESRSKIINSKNVPKISAKNRDFSRKKAKQLLQAEQ